MQDLTYPGLFHSSDSVAATQQRRHFRSLRGSLVVLILGAVFALFPDTSKCAAVLAAVLFAATIALTLLMAYRRFERSWYNARAVAESVKTRTWRYIMRAEPYNVDDSSARSTFVQDLTAILKENEDITKTIPAGEGEAISTQMDQVRQLSLPDRKDYYKKNRVEEQLTWYAKHAGYNRNANTCWYSLMVFFQVCALVCVLLKLEFPTAKVFPTGLFTTLAGATLSWSQAKRFAELSASYNLTVHELSIIKSNYARLSNEQEFSAFVRDTEAAFSREHTLWVARRGV